MHKAQPHSISLSKIVDAGDGDLLKAFEILLPRIPECSDLPGSEIPQQLLLGASLAAYVAQRLPDWMAPWNSEDEQVSGWGGRCPGSFTL